MAFRDPSMPALVTFGEAWWRHCGDHGNRGLPSPRYLATLLFYRVKKRRAGLSFCRPSAGVCSSGSTDKAGTASLKFCRAEVTYYYSMVPCAGDADHCGVGWLISGNDCHVSWPFCFWAWLPLYLPIPRECQRMAVLNLR